MFRGRSRSGPRSSPPTAWPGACVPRPGAEAATELSSTYRRGSGRGPCPRSRSALTAPEAGDAPVGRVLRNGSCVRAPGSRGGGSPVGRGPRRDRTAASARSIHRRGVTAVGDCPDRWSRQEKTMDDVISVPGLGPDSSLDAARLVDGQGLTRVSVAAPTGRGRPWLERGGVPRRGPPPPQSEVPVADGVHPLEPGPGDVRGRGVSGRVMSPCPAPDRPSPRAPLWRGSRDQACHHIPARERPANQRAQDRGQDIS